MGLFRFGKKKTRTSSDDAAAILEQNEITLSPSTTALQHPAKTTNAMTKRGSYTRQKSIHQGPTMDHLPDLILGLNSAVETGHERCIGSLQNLFALSEHGHTDNRKEMVRADNGKLVPALLQFLNRCERKSSAQYLTLLVLNNISIPMENKRVIAFTHGGAKLFANLLCDDPSCHLMAIILVNLTFSETELRRDLVSEQYGIGLVESLAFALRVASLTSDEYEARKDFVEEIRQQDNLSAADKLAMLMAEDHRLRPEQSNASFRRGKSLLGESSTKEQSQQCFPETALWCLSAMKNLTRPCKDAAAAHVLIKSGIFSLILQYVTIPKEVFAAEKLANLIEEDSPSSTSENTPTADPLEPPINSPSNWDSNSLQSAALYIIFNLAACPVSRDYVFEADAVAVLSAITEYPNLERENDTDEQMAHREFQCLKARMALSYLLGSQGSYGQSKITSISSTVNANPSDSPLIMSEADVYLTFELIVNTLHQRGKAGAGGYSAATFNLKYVALALRCLLTHTANQSRVAKLIGRQLNTLLMKVLAQHSLCQASSIDAETAECAIFCLYLQSNYGFDQTYLSLRFTTSENHGELAAKVFVSYRQQPTITPTGRHAVEQLLLRLEYLIFGGELSDLVDVDFAKDLDFDGDLLSKADGVEVGDNKSGAKPRDDILNRPILRTRKPKKGRNARAPWENKASVSVFANALQAVQQLSYGSVKVRHIDTIDDVMIANNIANSANGEKTESYNFMWVWEDKATEISRNLERQTSAESNKETLLGGVSARFTRSTGGSEVAGLFYCGSLCTTDTTV